MKIPLKKILLYSALVLLGLVIVFLVCRLMLNLSAVGHALSWWERCGPSCWAA